MTEELMKSDLCTTLIIEHDFFPWGLKTFKKKEKKKEPCWTAFNLVHRTRIWKCLGAVAAEWTVVLDFI